MKRVARGVKNLILTVMLLALLTTFIPTLAFADRVELDAVDYLDYQLTSPEYIYADEQIVAVSCAGKVEFFYEGKIIKTDLIADKQMLRRGSYLYYFNQSLLKRVEIGTFTEQDVKDSLGNPITANCFAISDSRLLAINSSGANYYQGDDFSPIPPPYVFDSALNSTILAATVCTYGGDDYFTVAGSVYKNGESVYTAEDGVVFKYVAGCEGGMLLSDGSSIYRLTDGVLTTLYLSDGSYTPAGLYPYGDGCLFIDTKSCDVMQLTQNGRITKFLFDVEITTDASLIFTPTPETVTVKKGSRLHRGTIENGIFTFSGTDASTPMDEDFIKIGTVNGYSVLCGKSGYAFAAADQTVALEQNTPITFEKGYVLYDCYAYLTCFAARSNEIFKLNKGDEVTVESAFIFNGTKYYLINTDAGRGFVLAGEITEKLIPTTATPKYSTGTVTGRDYTLMAIIAVLLGATVYVTAMALILIKKEHIKL